MKHLLQVIVLFCLLASAPALAVFPIDLQSTKPKLQSIATTDIYHGKGVGEGGQSWKFMVYWSSNTGSCSGSFITRNAMITASHCVDDISDGRESNSSLYITSFKGSEYAFAKYISSGNYRAYAHPGYSGTNYQYRDVAVIVFNENILPYEGNYRPVNTVTTEHDHLLDYGDLTYMVGAGTTGYNRNDGTLRFAKGRIMGYKNGSAVLVKGINLGGVCSGDSGGGLFVSYSSDLIQIGITSTSANRYDDRDGDDCSPSGYFAFLGATNMNWIWNKVYQ